MRRLALVLAHPLGNVSVNHHLGVVVGPDSVELTHLVDLAEIPAFQALRSIDEDDDGVATAVELAAWAGPECARRLEAVRVEVAGRPLGLVAGVSSAETAPGQAGLLTLRITCTAAATTSFEGPTLVTVDNDDDRGRVGWNEVVVAGSDVGIDTDAPSVSPSLLLTSYPEGAASDTRSASITVTPGEGPSAAAPPVVGVLGDLVAGGGSPGAVAVAIAAAFALGLGHALAPGHGKTLMAAFLVGRSGMVRNAVGLGVSVAVSHTVGVAMLGVLTLVASSTFEPAVVYPYLSVVAGAIVLVLGVSLLGRAGSRLLGSRYPSEAYNHDHGDHDGHHHGDADGHPHHHGDTHRHHHDHGHDRDHAGSHDHHDHGHGRSKRWWRHRHVAVEPVGGWKAFAALGLSGGLVPSASAVVLLLGAVHLGRIGLGVVLVAAFGLGMAAALTGVGVLVVVLGGRGIERLSRRASPTLTAALPLIAGVAVLGVGAYMTWSAVAGLA
ncbi:hypothetical protein BH24ACT7_BH24ACT7_11880 [soil metagenome]